MQLSRWIGVAAGAIAVATVCGVNVAHARSTSRSGREIARIRAHFDSVLSELGRRDVSGLSANQRTRRAALIDSLRAYRDRGAFPHNYDFPDRAMPYFVDRGTGALCAVANLLAATGRRDIVDRVAAANDNAWVRQLAGDSAFTAWLDANGITLAEAARIQIAYVRTVSTGQLVREIAAAIATPIAAGAAVGSSIVNLNDNADGHRRTPSVMGMASGLGLSALSADLLTKRDFRSYRGDALFGLATGGVSVALAARSMRRHGAYLAAQRDSARTRLGGDVSIAPYAAPGHALGAMLSVQF